ncbi:MAG: hypothetical protein D6760_13600, partial [Deltaproteobacteria bacterium]
SSCEPNEKAWRGFLDTVRNLLPGTEVEVLQDDHPAPAEWPKDVSPAGLDALAQRWLDRVPDDESDSIYVVYLERLQFDRVGEAGSKRPWIVRRGGRYVYVPGFILSCNMIEHAFAPFVGRTQRERFVLTHEFGHTIGLVANEGHSFPGDLGHCREHGCAMRSLESRSLFSALTVGAPWSRLSMRFGDRCRSDIAAVQRWVDAATTTAERHDRAGRFRHDARLLAIAEWLERHGREAEAFRVIRQTAARDDASPELHAAYGGYLRQRGDLDAAIEEFRRAVELGAGRRTRFALARMLCGRGKYDEALDLIRPLPERPTMFEVPVIAWALEGTGRPEQAARLFRWLSRQRGVPRGYRYETRLNLARLLGRMGRCEEARHLLAKFESWNWIPALIDAGRFAAQRGEAERARGLLRRAEELALQKLLSSKKAKDEERRLSLALSAVEASALLDEDQGLESLLALIDRLAADRTRAARHGAGYRLAAALVVLGRQQEARRRLLAAWGSYLPQDAHTDPCLNERLRQVLRKSGAGEGVKGCAVRDDLHRDAGML